MFPITPPFRLIALMICALGSAILPVRSAASSAIETAGSATRDCDRVWLISTRCLPYSPCAVNLDAPQFSVHLKRGNRWIRSSVAEFDAMRDPARPMVVYVHGNRMESDQLQIRSQQVYQSIARCRSSQCVDWVIWSWPSSQEGFLLRDFRLKLPRTDSQSLYLARFLSEHVGRGTAISMIGYSFGGRIVAGSLHALAGKPISGRRLNHRAMTGANIGVGLIAPAIESDSLSRNGKYCCATKNMSELTLLYNRRDAVLKRFWCLYGIRKVCALGYSGPKSFAPGVDGRSIEVRAKNCSGGVGRSHSETQYYQSNAMAGREMAGLINRVNTRCFEIR